MPCPLPGPSRMPYPRCPAPRATAHLVADDTQDRPAYPRRAQGEREVGDAYAAKGEWDPRKEPDYAYYRIEPQELRAWGTVPELKGRLLMKGGRWLV